MKKNNELTTLRKKALSILGDQPVGLWNTFTYIIENGQLFNCVNANKNVLAKNVKDFNENSDEWCEYIEMLDLDPVKVKIAMFVISTNVPVSITDKLFNYVV